MTPPSLPPLAPLPMEHLRFDGAGLLPAIAQDWLDGSVLMVAWMNREAIARSLATAEVHYWSRSRQELWHKGATSGQIQRLRGVRYDCDADVLLLTVEQLGAAPATRVPPAVSSGRGPSRAREGPRPLSPPPMPAASCSG